MKKNRRDTLLEMITRDSSLLAARMLNRGILRIPLRIAGIRVDLLTASSELDQQARTYFHEYLADGPAMAELFAQPLDAPLEYPKLWEDLDPEFGILGESVVQRDFVARRLGVSGGTGITRGIAYLAPNLDDAFHNLLRWFLSPILLDFDGFVLHGAGAVRDGRGYVFFGQSGAGKSTSMSLVAGADPEATVLGDDSVIIRMEGRQAFLYAAPLGCGYSREAPPACRAPLGGIFSLLQSPEHQIEPLSVSQGIATLLASAMAVHFNEEIARRFELAARFAAAPCGIKRLRFSRDAGFWPRVLAQGARPRTRNFVEPGISN